MPHWIVDATPALTAIVGVAWILVQLKTKDQVRTGTDEIKDKLDGINITLAAHVASDEQKHTAIDDHLMATDKRVGRIENKVWT